MMTPHLRLQGARRNPLLHPLMKIRLRLHPAAMVTADLHPAAAETEAVVQRLHPVAAQREDLPLHLQEAAMAVTAETAETEEAETLTVHPRPETTTLL